MWLNFCRERCYVALKVYVHTSLVHRELPFYRYIASRVANNSSYKGQENIRKLLGPFNIIGPYGKHIVLVLDAAQMSLRDMKVVFKLDGFDEDFVKGVITELLHVIDFLYLHVEVVYTGIS